MKKNEAIFGQRRKPRHYSESEKRQLIEYYLSSGKTKKYVWNKFTGDIAEHGSILSWMRQLGYIERNYDRSMMSENIKEQADSLYDQVLKQRVEELELKLREAEMRAIAYSKMIDIAEQELQIKIRKKYESGL